MLSPSVGVWHWSCQTASKTQLSTALSSAELLQHSSGTSETTGCSAGMEGALTRQGLHMGQTQDNYGSSEQGADPSGTAINSAKRLPEFSAEFSTEILLTRSQHWILLCFKHCSSKAKFNKSSMF